MQSEYSKGAKDCRDNILATIIRIQNGLGCDIKNLQYQILQELLENIEKHYGSFMKDYKG